METARLLLLLWSVHAAIGVGLSAPILFFGRKRIARPHWGLLALVLVIPFCVWALVMFSPLATGRKSLANLGEPVYIAAAMPLLALVRVAVGPRLTEKAYAAGFVAALCVVAAAVFFWVPCLPE